MAHGLPWPRVLERADLPRVRQVSVQGRRRWRSGPSAGLGLAT
jgi:hypothetical protein